MMYSTSSGVFSLPSVSRREPWATSCTLPMASKTWLGSRDPEKDEPGSVEVVFRTATDDWSPDYNVTENS